MSALTDFILDAYSYDLSDIDKLAGKLTERRRAAWVNQLSDLARVHGCNQLAATPKGADARELRRMSTEDAESIASTFNRELANLVSRIVTANPRAQRSVYVRQIDAWAARRDRHKALTIALQTDSTARQFAQLRFWEMNDLQGGRFVMRGAVPVCRECIRIMGRGVLTLAFVRAHPCPRHINCGHLYQQLNAPKLDCEKLWLG